MSHSSPFVALVIAATTLGTGSLNAQQNPLALEAEIETTFTTSAGQQSVPGHYYRSQAGKTREDSPLGSIITDVTAGTITLLNPATKEAKVIVMAGQPPPPAPTAGNALVPFEAGTIEGHAVTKVRQEMAGQTQELWTAADLGLVVLSKVVAPDFAMTRELRNFSLHEPNPAVFLIPNGYTVTQAPPPPLP
jgi:hypothetical protein